MKAILCKAYGPPSSLTLEDLESPTPGPKEVLVSVKACGLNFPDTLIIQGLYQFKPELPFSPGSDLSGVVKAVGDAVKHLKVGDEVFGFVPFGALAEEVIVPSNACFQKPENMNFAVAASFMMAYGTSYHALKDRAKLKSGETLLVLGASGGVGLAAVELGKLMGAKVIAAASTDEKLALCTSYGADLTINYEKEDLKSTIKALTNNKGADVIYDPVGGDYSEAAFRGIAWEGRYLVVGFAAGTIPKLPLNLPLLKGAAVVGVFWGGFAIGNPKANMDNTITLMQWHNEGKLRPHIYKTYPLKDTSIALELMMKRQAQGKLVVAIE